MTTNDIPSCKTIRRVHVPSYLGFSATKLWQLEQSDSTFPRRVRIGKRGIFYRLEDLDRWLDAQVEG